MSHLEWDFFIFVLSEIFEGLAQIENSSVNENLMFVNLI